MRWLNMRWLRLAAPALAVSAWLTVSLGQQPSTPPPAAPPETPPPASTPPAAGSDEGNARPAPAAADEPDDVFIPTEELQPDAAVTFPVDI